MSIGARLRIACDGAVPTRARVWLDDNDITASVRSVRPSMVVGEINTAEIGLIVRNVEIDASVLAEIQAAALRAITVGEPG